MTTIKNKIDALKANRLTQTARLHSKLIADRISALEANNPQALEEIFNEIKGATERGSYSVDVVDIVKSNNISAFLIETYFKQLGYDVEVTSRRTLMNTLQSVVIKWYKRAPVQLDPGTNNKRTIKG